jgi:hypothetical protein
MSQISLPTGGPTHHKCHGLEVLSLTNSTNNGKSHKQFKEIFSESNEAPAMHQRIANLGE